MRPVLIFLTALLLSNSTSAHHDVSEDIDPANPITLQGSVTLVEWINPHVVMHIESLDSQGLLQLWLIQANTPNSLLRQGLNRNSISHLLNIEVAVVPSQAINCQPDCYAYGLMIKDSLGREYILDQILYDKMMNLIDGQ